MWVTFSGGGTDAMWLILSGRTQVVHTVIFSGGGGGTHVSQSIDVGISGLFHV